MLKFSSLNNFSVFQDFRVVSRFWYLAIGVISIGEKWEECKSKEWLGQVLRTCWFACQRYAQKWVVYHLQELTNLGGPILSCLASPQITKKSEYREQIWLKPSAQLMKRNVFQEYKGQIQRKIQRLSAYSCHLIPRGGQHSLW